MITALNGMLIVAMLFAWGMHTGSKWLMATALASAGVAWLVNATDETGGKGNAFRGFLALLSISLTLAGLAIAASTLR